VKIRVTDECAKFPDACEMAHSTIEHVIKVTAPAVKAVIVDFHSNDSSCHNYSSE